MWKLIVLEDWLSRDFTKRRRHIEVSENKEFRELVNDRYVPLKTEGGYLIVTQQYRGIPIEFSLNVNNIWYRYFKEEPLPLEDQHD